MKKQGKRITALTVSAMLMLNMATTAVPVFAAGESKVYTHDGYTVEYTVKNEWTGNQNIEVTITNTGDDVLSGWAMGYNAFGEIGGLWNAQVYGHQGTEYILSSAGYNDELAPGQSTNFGYTLTGDKFKIPQNIVNCAERVDITEGYNVYYNITADFVDTYQAEMIIENTSDTDISAWQLSFDGNVTINDLWNGKLIENNNGSFKVKNSENNSVIAAGSSVSFNFGGAKNIETEPNLGYSEPVETLPPVPVVTDEFSETEATDEADVTNPETDPIETEIPSETVLPEITTVTEPVVVPVSEVIFSNYRLTGVVIPMEFDFEIDPEVDSDNDGLPDYLEKEIGTDRYNADTDGDGLPDGYEYFTLGTDPKKSDSDDNGISDADEDFDEDGLTNLEEYELGTDPFSKDTDHDGLSDYDEVKIHNTDPLKYDTDGDKVSDGDEIILGLDPNNPATFGYPDNEYTTVQTVGEDSSALDYINNIEDNPYSVTIEITAAGVADNNLTAGESGYSYSILQNDAVLGVVPEFDYSDGLSVTDVVIKFKIDDSAVDNKLGVYADEPEFNGINRLQVFKYFEDNNILLPIETFYDEETKTVYTHVDELGTYCLMDMEMWINYLENLEPGNYYEEDDEANSANIAFCLDTRYIADESSFDSVKSDMKAIAEDAFDRYTDVKVYVYYQELGMSFRAKDNLLMGNDSKNYFTSYEEAEAAIDSMAMPKKSVAYDLVHASNYMIDVCDKNCKAEKLDKNIITMYHITNDDNIVGSVDDAKQLIRTVEDSSYTDENDKQAYRINVSVICPNGKAKKGSYMEKLVGASKGIFYSGNTQEVQVQAQVMTLNLAANNNEQEMTTADTIKENVVEICGDGDGRDYNVITSTGLVKNIILDTPLRRNDKYINKNIVPTDTDKDGIYDWDEVNVEFILNLDKNANISDRDYIIASQLPTIEEMINKYDWSFYVKNVYGKVYSYKASHLKEKSVFILPIISDPTSIDSDDDGLLDNAYVNNYADVDEKNKIPYEWVKQSDEYFNVSDPNPLKKEIIWQWPLLDTNGNKVSRISSGFYEQRSGKYHSAFDISSKDEKKVVHNDYQVVAAYDGILKCVKNFDGGGCGIEIEHTINGKKYTSRYLHMRYYDNIDDDGNEIDNSNESEKDNSNHEFIQYINKVLEYRGKGETFSKNIWGEEKMAGNIQDVTEFNIYVKAGTCIGIASGTNYDKQNGTIYRKGYEKHLDFKITDNNNNKAINPISFSKSLDADGIADYKSEMYINVPKDLYNACGATGCYCKDEEEKGEMYEIRNKYKIPYTFEKSS